MKKILILLFALCAYSGFSQNKRATSTIKELPVYNFISGFNSGYAYVQKIQNDSILFGYIDKTGEEIIPCTQQTGHRFRENGVRFWGFTYDDYYFGSPQYYYVNSQNLTVLKKEGQQFLYNVPQKKFRTDGYKQIIMFRDNFIALKMDSTLCVMNDNGKILFEVKTKFDICIINKNRYVFRDSFNQWNFVDSNKVLIKKLPTSEYQEIKVLGDSRLSFTPSGGDFGLLDQDGNIVVSAKFDNISYFNEGYALARTFEDSRTNQVAKIELIDINGTPIIIKNKAIRLLQDRFFVGGSIPVEVKTENRYAQALMDDKGNLVLKPVFENLFNFQDGVAPIEFNRAYGCIDKTGKLLFRTRHMVIFREGLAVDYVDIYENGTNSSFNYEIIDKQGKVLMQTRPSKRQ
jgi:WG containing repeat